MITPFDPHARCLERLPAFVAQTLPRGAATAVLTHTGECVHCGQELRFARRVQRQFARDWRSVTPLFEPEREEAAFDQLWSRTSSADPTVPKPRQRWWRNAIPLAAAAAVVFGVGLLWYQNASAPDYRTLADSAPRGCELVRVQVDVHQPASDTVRLLESTGAR